MVFSARGQKREHGVTALDIAKAILDEGIHPPTIYFPLIVEEALMIEPTETETREHWTDSSASCVGLPSTRPMIRGPCVGATDDAGRSPGRGDGRSPAGLEMAVPSRRSNR